MNRRWSCFIVAVATVVLAMSSTPAHAGPPATVRVDTAVDGTEANGPSRVQFPLVAPPISRDGRYVAFASDATNLAPNNGQVRTRIYRKDLKTGSIVQVDRAISGSDRRDVNSAVLDMTADGRFVLYSVTDPHSALTTHWFLRDVDAATTRHMIDRTVALNDNGDRALVAGPRARVVDLATGVATGLPGDGIAISDDGTLALVMTPDALVPGDTDTFDDVYLIDTTTAVATRVPPNIDGFSWQWCGAQRFRLDRRAPIVAFTACTAEHFHAMLFDARTGTAVVVPEATDLDTSFPSVTDDERRVSFTSYTEAGSGLIELRQWDRRTNTVNTVSNTFDGSAPHAPPTVQPIAGLSSYSADGRYVAYFATLDNLVADDTNGVTDIFRTRVA